MRRRAPAAVMFAIVVLCAAPARAQGWRWLEKLSGPGDFYGYEVNLKLLCRYDNEQGTATRDEPKMKVLFGASLPCLSKNEDASPKQASVHPSQFKYRDGPSVDLSNRIFAFGVGVSYLRGSGDLEYPTTSEHVDRTVQIWAIEAFYDHRLSRRLDWGVAIGANIFVVPEADTFVRWSAEPRLTLELFDLRKGDRYAGTASLRVGAHFLFGRFDDEDFGALPGTYRSAKVDVGPSFRLVLDFDRNPFKPN